MLYFDTVPDIRALVDPLLGQSYEAWDTVMEPELQGPHRPEACWLLVRHLFLAGFGLDLARDPAQASQAFTEVWFRDSSHGQAFPALQPWDAYILAARRGVADHLGLVVDGTYFVHIRKRTGICLESLTRWQPRVLQVARLHQLMA